MRLLLSSALLFLSFSSFAKMGWDIVNVKNVHGKIAVIKFVLGKDLREIGKDVEVKFFGEITEGSMSVRVIRDAIIRRLGAGLWEAEGEDFYLIFNRKMIGNVKFKDRNGYEYDYTRHELED